MSIYERFCTCTEDENGALKKIDIHYNDKFNFAYDVVDEIARENPEKRAIVWCNANDEERIFTFSDVMKESNRYANALSCLGIRKGDYVMLCLKKHYVMQNPISLKRLLLFLYLKKEEPSALM